VIILRALLSFQIFTVSFSILLYGQNFQMSMLLFSQSLKNKKKSNKKYVFVIEGAEWGVEGSQKE
jgi:hypothetical protein